MLNNKKGAALMQVLLVTAILAGMATMLLRASLSRTSSARQTRQSISSELLIEACQAEINMMWSQKTPETFKRDLAGCWMNCKIASSADTGWLSNPTSYESSQCHTTPANATRSYTCDVPVPGGTVAVTATFSTPSGTSPCKLTYTIDRDNIDQL